MNINPDTKYIRFFPAILTFLTFLTFLFSSISPSTAVSVIPNKAVLSGTVKEYSVGSSSLYDMSPEQTIYKLTIIVEASEEIEIFPNFLKGKDGQILTFFTKENPSFEIYGKRIKTQVEYSGDEKGGRFWISKNITILK